MRSHLTAIIKPTHDCNLACLYCYVGEHAETGNMTLETLRETTNQLLSIPGKNEITFLWHGGEPLLMGLPFYEKAIQYQTEFNRDKKIKNNIQSNVCLINDDYLDFFEKHRFSIGSSLDGPEEIHNDTRPYKNGSGSFGKVWNNLSKIRDRNKRIKQKTRIGEAPIHLGGGVITILTKRNIGRIMDIYEFFKAHNFSFKLNPLIKSGQALNVYEDMGIGADEYGEALIKLFDRWYYETEEGIDVDPLSDIMGNLITGSPSGCNFSENCRESFVSIGPKGDVYPCGRFDGDIKFWMGNVHQTTLSDIILKSASAEFALRGPNNVTGCEGCKYKRICNSGCVHNAYMVRGNVSDKDFYCASYKLLFSHIERAISPELNNAEIGGGENELKDI